MRESLDDVTWVLNRPFNYGNLIAFISENNYKAKRI